jgi:hypothetical protein
MVGITTQSSIAVYMQVMAKRADLVSEVRKAAIDLFLLFSVEIRGAQGRLCVSLTVVSAITGRRLTRLTSA